MKVKCNCGREVTPEEKQKQCKCGLYYGLTPYFEGGKENAYFRSEKEEAKA